MPTPAAVFDSSIERWIAEGQTPWGQLRDRVTLANLRRHLGPGPLDILDAGGGNGRNSIPLAAEGHRVTIVDYSAEMLADAARTAEAAEIRERITLHQANLLALPQLFPQPRFDVVLCHNVLQYIDDVPALLAAAAAPLRPGGLLSIISVNRYAMPYRAAFFHGDLAAAYAKLDQRSEAAILFGATMSQYSADEIVAMLPAAGCAVEQDYGIRCIWDYWGDNQRKSDPAIIEQLNRLELALTDRHPYKLLARYFQVIARAT